MNNHRRHVVLLFVTLFQVMVGFGIVIPLMPSFVDSLGGGSREMGLLVTVWALGQFLFSPYWGKLSDQVGRRPIMIVGLLGYCVAFAGMAMADRIWLLMLARFLGGVLSAATIPVAQAYIADITSDIGERGQRIAWMGGAMNLGFICGPAIGGLLSPLGVQNTFVLVGCLALVNAIVTWFMLPEPPARPKPTTAARQGRLELFRIALTGPLAVFSILAFVGTYGGSAMFSMLGYSMMDKFNAGPDLIGWVFTVEGGMAALVQAFGVGWALRRFSEEGVLSFGLAMGALGLLGLAWSPSIASVFGAALLISVGISLLRPTIAAVASKRTTLEQGVTMGIQTSFDALGRSIGPSAAGLLYGVAAWLPFAGAAALYVGALIWLQRFSRVDPTDRPSQEQVAVSD